jgi:glyoxylase-like metal-dependent hydrolase (beta-lactamase superfamily II)
MPHRSAALLDRRALLLGAGAAGLVGITAPLQAAAPPLGTQAPAWYRFRIGAFEATVVSDGPIPIGDPAGAFKGASKADLDRLLADSFLPADNVVLDQNALVLNTGRGLYLFDTGAGSSPAFGPTTGRLAANLRAAGFAPDSFEGVILTHAHPDHCWGLVAADGAPAFPNARVYLSQADHAFWTAEAQPGQPDMMKEFLAGTRRVLGPLRERITFVRDGGEVVPGVTALSAPGHTVGHMAYAIASDASTLLVTGDLVHHHVLLLRRPRLEFVFDTDPAQAVASRLRVLDMAAAGRLQILSYHFPFPGLGHVAKAGEGYAWVQSPWRTLL